MERKQKKKETQRRGRPELLGDVSGVILSIVSLAGIIALAALAPNAMRLLKYTPLFRHQRRYYVNTVIERCIQRGLMKREQKEGIGTVLRLTPKGEALLTRYQFDNFTMPKPRRWDKKYRIIVFDIKETKRFVRDSLRTWLERLGFIQLQRSVWVYPYECQEIVTLLKAHMHVGKDVLYITADSIENDTWLRESFELS